MDELFRALNPVNVGRVAGAGNKIVFMLDAMADYYINFVLGFKSFIDFMKVDSF